MTLTLPTARGGLRPGLRWLLGLTACACAWALWWPGATAPAANGLAVGASLATAGATAAVDATAPAPTPALPLPERLARPEWPEAAGFDPFVGVVSPPPPPARPLPAPAPELAVAPPPPPPRPEPRFVGRVVSPDGHQVVYLAWRDQVLSAAVGDPAGEGYVLEAIGPDAVLLNHPQDGVRLKLPIPAASRSGGMP